MRRGRLPDDLPASLNHEAKVRRVTKSTLIKESIARELHGQPKAGDASCFDLARDLAGSIKRLPKDLAHNPRYMDGFRQ